MTTAKAQAAQFLVARAPTPGTQPTTGWMTTQPNPDGLQNFHPQYTDVARDPLSPNMTPEKGDHVGLTASPTLVHDLNKGLLDLIGPSLLRSNAKVPGNKGLQWYYPTAATATDYTVAALGDLTAKLLVFARGFVNAANNGLKVVGAASTGIAIKATGLVAETVITNGVPGAGSAMVEVVGVEAAAAADIQMNASGNLTSSTTDFTALNLKVGHRIWFRAGAGTNEFPTLTASVPNLYATVAAVPTTNLIQLKWHSFTPAADTATGRSIRLYFGPMYINYADGNADYIDQPAYWGELRDTGVGTANAEVYSYVKDFVVDSVSLAMPTTGKIEATLALKARTVTDPVDVGSRLTGPSTAYPALAMEMFDTVNDMLVHRVVDASSNLMIGEISTATLTLNHNFSPRNQHTIFGTAAFIPGTIEPKVSMETFYERKAVPIAISANTECRYEAIWKNGQSGLAIDLPTLTLREGNKKYAKNMPVMMTVGMPAHRDPTTNVIAIVNIPPYLP